MKKLDNYMLYLSGVINENQYLNEVNQVGDNTTPADPAAPAAVAEKNAEPQKSNAGYKGNLDLTRLIGLLPSAKNYISHFKSAISKVKRGQEPNRQESVALAHAFVDLLNADSKQTLMIAQLLKRISLSE